MTDSPEIRRHLTHLALAGLAESTIYGRRRALARLADCLPVPLLSATEDDLIDWRASIAHLTTGSVYNLCVHVREFYRWAAIKGLIPASPAEGIPVPRRPARVPRPVSEAALAVVVAAAPPRIRLQLVLAAWCGLRACEIAGLRCEHIDLERRVLIIAADATKGLRERIIPLCDFAIAEITEARLPLRGLAFRRRDGQPGKVSAGLMSTYANRHLRACGVPATLHQLRHRFGTQAYRTTRDLVAVQELMGHASIVTTRLYTLADQPAQVAVVQALPVPPRLRAAS